MTYMQISLLFLISWDEEFDLYASGGSCALSPGRINDFSIAWYKEVPTIVYSRKMIRIPVDG